MSSSGDSIVSNGNSNASQPGTSPGTQPTPAPPPPAPTPNPVKQGLSLIFLSFVIIVSGWISVEVIAQIPLLQEGALVRGSTYSPESLRKELEATRANMTLPEGDTSPFSRVNPLQPLINLLGTYGVTVSVTSDSTVPGWLTGYVNAAPQSPKHLSEKDRESATRLAELLVLPLTARTDLYRMLQRARSDAEFIKTTVLERTVQEYRAEASLNGMADDARSEFNGFITTFYDRAQAINVSYAECVQEISRYDQLLSEVSAEVSKRLSSGDPMEFPVSLPSSILRTCSRSNMDPIGNETKASRSEAEATPPAVTAFDPVDTTGEANETSGRSPAFDGGGLIRFMFGNRPQRLDLILIIGMMALGVLGASASQLIRSEDGKRIEMLASADMVGVMVRGVTATLVVYLGVSCGLIVFTTGDAQANPYALLLGCFIASVFSELVWTWAREVVGEKLTKKAASQ